MIDDAATLRDSSPHNMVRLLLPETYQDSARLLKSWLGNGTLQVDADPRFYLYTMRYRSHQGIEHEARGVIGALGLEPIGARILGHEETMAHTGVDRLELLRATRSNLDLIITLSPAPGLPALLEPEGPPRFAFEAEGVHHALYDLERESAAIAEAVDAHPLAIADGHHRFTAALEYQASRESRGGWDAIMAFVAPAEGSGLQIRPIHRFFPTLAIGDIGDIFDVHVQPVLSIPPTVPGSITMITVGGSRLLVPKAGPLQDLPVPWRSASTAVARELLYPRCGVGEDDAVFHPDPERLIGELAGAPDGAVLLMAAVPEKAVSDAAAQGLRFPRKTTLFIPKPRAGLVLRSF